jgi:hypothetical protein
MWAVRIESVSMLILSERRDGFKLHGVRTKFHEHFLSRLRNKTVQYFAQNRKLNILSAFILFCFICGLFNDAVNRSDHIASNDW